MRLIIWVWLLSSCCWASPVQPPATVLVGPDPQVCGVVATGGMSLVELKIIGMTQNPVVLKVEDFQGKVLFQGPPKINQRLPVSSPGVRMYATGSGGSLTIMPRFEKKGP